MDSVDPTHPPNEKPATERPANQSQLERLDNNTTRSILRLLLKYRPDRADTTRGAGMWKPDICIHHFPCDDGFAAAWIARRKWPDVVVKGTNYGLPFPQMDVVGKNILIADFSYKPDVLQGVLKQAKSIVILDHHKTAEADLEPFAVKVSDHARFAAPDVEGKLHSLADQTGPAILACFDMQRSGASLTWDFCFPDEPPPLFIRLIEDRDLQRLSLPESRPFSLLLRSYPYDFEKWDWIIELMSRSPDSALAEARAIERFYDRRLAEMIPTAILKAIGRWKDVPVAYAPYAFASDLANELLKVHPAAPFAAVVIEAYGARTYSLRSEDSRQDVSDVARTFGGGGHRNAAAFRVPA
jgi:hypothetical protein